jgi:hypothetical protein
MQDLSRITGPTQAQFRFAIIGALICYGLGIGLPEAGLITFDEDVKTARLWNYWGAWLPFEATKVWWHLSNFVLVVGLVGMWWYYRAARTALAIWYLCDLALSPFMGLLVLSAFESTLLEICGVLVLWLIVVSYWTPLSERFLGNA